MLWCMWNKTIDANRRMSIEFKKHKALGVILFLCLVLGVAYSALNPLGEAPDEPAHLAYVRFVTRNGRLPATLEERIMAGYRADLPPLYYLLVAGMLGPLDEEPPTRLKFVGDTPRRLIPTDGQTIASVVHTADEAWPWRGLPLVWHLGRLVSVVLMALAVLVTYAIAWRLTGRPVIAAAAAAIHAFSPQALFIGGSLNDDNLLILLAGLLLLTMITYSRQVQQLRLRHMFLLGLLLGLATVTKYNVPPLWAIVMSWIGWAAWRRLAEWRAAGKNTGLTGPRFLIAAVFRIIVGPLAALLAGIALAAGWWFLFVWRNFNQVERLGWLHGSLEALIAGTSDASVQTLAAGGRPTLPPLADWQEWLITLFQSYWGFFGGGSTIHLPAWIYWLLALACVAALAGFLRRPVVTIRTWPSPALLFLLTPLFYLPLPVLRFGLTGGAIAETAQGRHLFSAISIISLFLALGLAGLGSRQHHATAPPPTANRRLSGHKDVFYQAARLAPLLALPLLLFFASLYGLVIIRGSYPPPIPLQTTPGAAAAEHLLQVQAAEGITLMGYELAAVTANVLPVSLVWQAEAVPEQDYLLELILAGSNGKTIGGWLGHPLGGRYPTRAWDKGDVLRHTVPVPLLPGQPPTSGALRLRLLDPSGQPAGSVLTLAGQVALPAIPARPVSPEQLRADELAAAAPFTYRSTLSLAWPGPVAAGLVAPDGTVLSPDLVLSGSGGSIAHFIVGPAWPSGDYTTTGPVPPVQVTISNRLRQFELPPMDHTVQANFAGYLTLLGYDLPQRRARPGESFPVTLHWRAEQTMGKNLTVFNHLLDAEGVQRGGADRIPHNYYTTLLWVPGEIVSDAYAVPVAVDAPPGVYWLDVGLYPSDRPALSLPLLVDGRPIDRNSVYLGPVKIGGPPPQVTAAGVQPGHPLNATFGQPIRLLGFDLARTQPEMAGASLPMNSKDLTLFWRAEGQPAADYTVFVHLLNEQGEVAGQADSPPAAGAYPTSLWDAGETVVDRHALPDLPPGRYELKVGLYRPETGERLAAAGSPDGAVKLADLAVD